jgi:GTP cyclohydrolase I
MIEANHMCACIRGVKHDSTMMTSKLSGQFINSPEVREEFYDFVKRLK